MPMPTYYRNRYGFRRGGLPVADEVSDSSVTLPFHGSMTSGMQECVAHHVLKSLERGGPLQVND